MTEAGHKIIKQVMDIVNKYHWDESNSQIDYFHTNFHFDLGLGNYNKDFIDGVSN